MKNLVNNIFVDNNIFYGVVGLRIHFLMYINELCLYARNHMYVIC
jgi:hypothetical protein